jgi:hypothetical protein
VTAGTESTGTKAVGQAISRAIYEDAIQAYTDPLHPCHPFRHLQTGVPDYAWQLPEPFNGHSANAGLVFLGLNPSYDPVESVPRLSANFEEWDSYYRGRFDSPSQTWHKLYRRYQRIGELALTESFRLGIDAMVLESIRFRSAQAMGCQDPAVVAHELPTTRALIAELTPRVLIANGAGALGAIQSLWPDLQSAIPIGTPLLKVEHRPVRLEVAWGALDVIPTRHLSAAFGYKPEMLDVISGIVRQLRH